MCKERLPRDYHLSRLVWMASVILYSASLSLAQENFFQAFIVEDHGRSGVLTQYFVEPTIISLDAQRLDEYVRRGDYQGQISLQIGSDRIWNMMLTEHDIRGAEYVAMVATPSGIQELPRSRNITFQGHLIGDPESAVRLSIDGNFIFGYIQQADDLYFIEQRRNFEKAVPANHYIFYHENTVLDAFTENKCGVTLMKNADNLVEEKRKQRSAGAVAPCIATELAVAADWSYSQDHGGTQGAINQSIAVMNTVIPNYSGSFSSDIDFQIVEHFISGCSTCDPWSSSTDPSTLLSSFRTWGPSGFSNTFDLGQLWTDRDFTGSTVGLAYVGTVCGFSRYHILQDYTTSATSLRVLTAHEIGHNFDCSHDASGAPYIMAPSVNSSSAWSSASISSVNSYISGVSCLEACCPDPDLNIQLVSLEIEDCTVGNPSTHSISVTITHGGGNGSGFNVNIDGTNHFQSFTSSPQTVIIDGLASDGSQAIPVTIIPVSSSDPGCQASGTYDAPTAGCGFLASENFNGCNLPSGWSRTTTMPWNWTLNGEPANFEWKFENATRLINNYDNGDNAGSLLTIDGSCMAYFDDDIISSTDYSGDITLTSPTYDITAFENLSLNFDYNFHNFEDGKVPDYYTFNDSEFEVQVYNGSSWVSVLVDNDDACPWTDVWPSGCTTSINLSIDSYRNANFKVRFLYTDGNDGKWTGMIALDNFEISGDLIYNGPCEQDLMVSESPSNGTYKASSSITTTPGVTVSTNAMYDAPSITIPSDFEVAAGATFEARTVGCNN